MNLRPRASFLLLCWSLAACAQAGQIYKWVDSAGQVTYSSSPPPPNAKGEQLAMPPPPASEEVLQAKDHAKRDEEQARELERLRLEREAARKAEEDRLRASQPPPPVVIEKPVYVPKPVYVQPVHPHPAVKPSGKPPALAERAGSDQDSARTRMGSHA